MKDGWNTALQKLLQRADPAAQAIVEAVAVHASDVKDLKSDWDGADSLSGLTSLDEGGVRLSLTNTALASQTVDDGTQITDLNHSDPIEVLHFEWFGSGSDDLRIKHVVLRLDPDADSGGRQVEQWRCQLFRVAQFPREGEVVLDRISRVVSVAATAPPRTFDFASASRGVAVGRAPDRTSPSTSRPPPAVEDRRQLHRRSCVVEGLIGEKEKWWLRPGPIGSGRHHVKRTYEVRDRADKRAIREFLKREGQFLLPLSSWSRRRSRSTKSSR